MDLFDDLEPKKPEQAELFEEPLEQEPNMLAYSYMDVIKESFADEIKNIKAGEISVDIAKISYGDATYRNFDFREVFINEKSKGEYYVKIKGGNMRTIANACMFLSNRLAGCDVGIIDPDNILNLDFHIFIKTSDEMMMCSINEMMGAVDDYITLKIRSTK